ncbi:hypothetical protein B0H14DRAFT_3492554 [Mycena olivaceomarginata]|nr:hypothetical protein B0H14DRAFT_3492554 [Mycena olivaceomarginata]
MSNNKSVDLAPLTNDEQAFNTSRNSTVPAQHLCNRYNFVYPVFPSATDAPLAKLVVVRRACLLSAPVPTEITVALSGVYHLIVNNTDTSLEWQFFPFPPSESIPTCAPGFSPPRATTTADGPTRDQLNNAPHLSQVAPWPRTPSEVANSPPLAVSPPPKPTTAKKKKSKPQQAKSASVVRSDRSGEDEPLSKCRKTTGKGNRAVSESHGPNNNSALCRSKRSEATAPKSPSGKITAAVQAKIDAMIPIIRTKLGEMLTERTKSGYCFIRHEETHYTITLSAFQGHRTYIPNNTFGPAPPPKKKDEPPKEPLVELVCFSAIDYEQVLQPPGACLLCVIRRCTPSATTSGEPTKCAKSWAGIEEIRGIMFPDAPIVPNMIPHLMEQVSTARDLYSSLRHDLTDALGAFFTSVRNYVAVSGEEVFRQEFKSSLPHATTRGQINTLIHAFNHYHDPKTAHLPLKPYELSDDERDDAGPSKSPRKVTLKVKESTGEEKEDGEMDEDAEGEVGATVEWKPESSQSSPRKKRKRTPSD